MASAIDADALYADKIEKYIIENYNNLIPQTSEITFDIWNLEKDEYGDDLLYVLWDNTPIYLNTKLTLFVWIGLKHYKVVYDIYWKIEQFPRLNYYECRGSKCRRVINLSFDHWCVSCHGDPDEWKISQMVEIFVKDKNDHDTKIKFEDISQFIRNVDIISYEEIESSEKYELLRTEQIMLKMRLQQIELEKAEREIISFRKRIEDIYIEFGFESREEMEKLMLDYKSKAADRIQHENDKYGILSGVVSEDPVA
jgi:hypothetical protein